MMTSYYYTDNKKTSIIVRIGDAGEFAEYDENSMLPLAFTNGKCLMRIIPILYDLT